MINLSDNALRIFRDLYCFEGESIDECFKRVAREFATTDEEFETAYELLVSNTWRPNTPVFFNAGTDHKIFSACFVVDLKDSMDSIYDVLNVSRKIFQNGAGVGIPIGNLREKSAPIFEGKQDTQPQGKSSGAVSFMKLFDAAGETTKSGGKTRRAAILCTLPIDHPDVMEFIKCKEIDRTLTNMNISVGVLDSFMKALEDGVPYTLHTPYDGSDRKEVNPGDVWNELCSMSHKTADPGVLFLDTINEMNPLKKLINISSTNPCLVGDTLITTNIGPVTIQQIIDTGIDNYEVLTFNTDRKILEFEPITNGSLTRKNTTVIELELEDGSSITVTPDHLIYTENRGYIEAAKLQTNDIILQVK